MYRRLSEFILFGSIFISLCAVAMCVETNLLLHLPLNNIGFYSFVFGATLVQYNLHYLLKRTAVENSERLAWSKKNKKVHKVLIATGIVLLVTGLFTFRIHHFTFLLFLGIITWLYSVPVLPFNDRKRIKDFGILKIITLSLIWTIVTVWFPVKQMVFEFSSFQLIFIRRFIFIFILCLLFDIRDAEIDRLENIKTIPVLTGIKKAYSLANLLIMFFILVSFMQYILFPDLLQLNAMLISAAGTLFMIKLTKKNNSDFVYLACVDGMMLLQALLVITGSL